MNDGRRVVTTAGTRQRLVDDPTPTQFVTITAYSANLGTIWVGGSTVDAAPSGSARGTPLGPGISNGFTVTDLYDIFLDATVSGDFVTFTYKSY